MRIVIVKRSIPNVGNVDVYSKTLTIKMIYDELDFFIIRNIYENKKGISTWDLAKKYFNISIKSKEDGRMVNKKNILIKYRLKRMSDEGFVLINDEIILIKERVKFQKHKFPDGYHQAILIKEEDRWCIFQL